MFRTARSRISAVSPRPSSPGTTRIEVLPNGVDTALFAPPGAEEKQRLRAAWRVPVEAVVVTLAGRKQEVKGFHVFLRVSNS